MCKIISIITVLPVDHLLVVTMCDNMPNSESLLASFHIIIVTMMALPLTGVLWAILR